MSFLPVPLQIAFLVLLFVAGHAGRRVGWLTPQHAGKMLNLVMMVGLPALFLADVSRIALHRDLLALPALAIFIMLMTFAIAALCGRRLQMPRATYGAFVISSMSINNGFLFPFVIAAWGAEAFAQLALFDLGNAIMQCTVIYAVAAAYGGHSTGAATILKRVLGFPPLWALAVALALNFGGVALPGIVTTVLGTGGRLIVLLVILALGVLVDFKAVRFDRVALAVGLRIIGGLLIALVCVELLQLEGLTRKVALLGAAAPIGFSVVVIANREALDRQFAASAASMSVLIALVYVPLALWLL